MKRSNGLELGFNIHTRPAADQALLSLYVELHETMFPVQDSNVERPMLTSNNTHLQRCL